MSVSFFSMSGTTDAIAFAVGAEAFARRWAICRSGNGGLNNENSVAARWVREPCERTRACVAPGYLVFTGIVVECPAEPHETESNDDISEDEASQDDISEDEACLPPRGPLPGNRNRDAIILEYHVVFSASYMVPVLLVRGRYTAAPMKTLGFGELVETLSTVSAISAAEKKARPNHLEKPPFPCSRRGNTRTAKKERAGRQATRPGAGSARTLAKPGTSWVFFFRAAARVIREKKRKITTKKRLRLRTSPRGSASLRAPCPGLGCEGTAGCVFRTQPTM